MQALVLSFNELTRIEGINDLSRLCCLDVAHNNIRKVRKSGVLAKQVHGKPFLIFRAAVRMPLSRFIQVLSAYGRQVHCVCKLLASLQVDGVKGLASLKTLDMSYNQARNP
jgi:Leucine-rich repeat (LRR) protein